MMLILQAIVPILQTSKRKIKTKKKLILLIGDFEDMISLEKINQGYKFKKIYTSYWPKIKKTFCGYKCLKSKSAKSALKPLN